MMKEQLNFSDTYPPVCVIDRINHLTNKAASQVRANTTPAFCDLVTVMAMTKHTTTATPPILPYELLDCI